MRRRCVPLALGFWLLAAGSSAARADDNRAKVAAAAPAAVQRARNWLLDKVRPDGSLTDWEHDNALIALALVESGVSVRDERFRRLVSYVLNRNSREIRFFALRAELLARMLPKMAGTSRRAAEGVLGKDLAALLKNQRDDGVWFARAGRWPNMDATYQAYQALYLCAAEGYKIPDEHLKRAAMLFLRHQKDNGAWSGRPYEDPDGGADLVTTVRAATCVAQVGEDVCTCRGTSGKAEEALRRCVQRGLAFHQVRNCYGDWGRDPNPVRDWFFYRQGYYLGRLLHVVPMDFLGKADLAKDWHLTMLNRQAGDGKWRTPTDENGHNNNIICTGFTLYQMAQLAKPVLICEMVENPEQAVLANRGLWTAVETLSLRAPQLMRYGRARLGLDYDRYASVPLIYLQITDRFRLADQEKENLRRYVAAGGTVVAQLDCGNRDLAAVAGRELAGVWPHLALEPLKADHAVWTSARNVGSRPVVLGLDDGVRTFAFVCQMNLVCDLAKGLSPSRQTAFQTFENMVHYALEGQMNLSTTLDVAGDQTEVKPGANRMVSVGLLKLTGDAASGTLPYDGWAAATSLMPKAAGIRLLGPKALPCTDIEHLKLCDVACLSGGGAMVVTDDEVAALKAYVAGGGFLMVEARTGDTRFERCVKRLATSLDLRMEPAKGSSLLTGKFEGGAVGFDVEKTHVREDGSLKEMPTPLRLLTLNGAVVGVYSPRDLVVSASGIRCWGLRGYAPSDAQRILANLILSRTTTSD